MDEKIKIDDVIGFFKKQARLCREYNLLEGEEWNDQIAMWLQELNKVEAENDNLREQLFARFRENDELRRELSAAIQIEGAFK